MDETDRRIKAEFERRLKRGERRSTRALSPALGCSPSGIALRIKRMRLRGEWEHETRPGSLVEQDISRAFAAILAEGHVPTRAMIAARTGLSWVGVHDAMRRMERKRVSVRAPAPAGNPHGLPHGVYDAIEGGLASGMSPEEVAGSIRAPEGFELGVERVRAIQLGLGLPTLTDPTPEEIAERTRAIRAENMREYRKRVAKDCSTMSERAKLSYRTPRFEEGWVAGA